MIKKLLPLLGQIEKYKFVIRINQLVIPIIALLLNAMLSTLSIAQVSPNLGQTDRWMKGAQEAMERNDFKSANSIFRELIDSGQALPDKMPYLFAETLFQLGQYDNSSNFLNKYQELTGFTGEFYKDGQELGKRLEGPLAAIAECKLCDRRGYRYQTCFTCNGKKEIEQDCTYCKGKGVVGCSRCSASGMITKINIFKIVEYFECDRCEGKGRLTCPVCEGTLREVSTCKTCSGTGKLISEELCSHEEETHTH